MAAKGPGQELRGRLVRVRVKGNGRAHPGSEQAGQPGSQASGSSPKQCVLPPRSRSHLPPTLEAVGKLKGWGEGRKKKREERVSGAREAT